MKKIFTLRKGFCARAFNHPLKVVRKYCYLAECKIVGYEIPRLAHDYERFFRVKRGDVVIDAGAHIGLFTLSIADRAGTIVAIEPEPKNLRALRYNIKLRNLDNVLIIEKALWNFRAKFPLYLGRTSLAHSLIQNLASSRSIEVDADTLDNIVFGIGLQKIDFVKLDIEGAEVEALEGAKQMLKRTSKIVVASYHLRDGVRTSNKIAQTLIHNGFQTRVAEDNLVYGYRG